MKIQQEEENLEELEKLEKGENVNLEEGDEVKDKINV